MASADPFDSLSQELDDTVNSFESLAFVDACRRISDWRQLAASVLAGHHHAESRQRLLDAGDPLTVATNDFPALRELARRYRGILGQIPRAQERSRESSPTDLAVTRSPDQPPAAGLAAPAPLALIMKGGGVKGLALAGAAKVLEQHFSFSAYGGTSAGAIAAVLLAAGYSASELSEILQLKDFRDFLDRPRLRRLWNFIAKRWLNSGRPVEAWVEDLVHDKIPREAGARMRDLPHRAIVYATNERDGTVEFDSEGRDRDVPAEFAVRCSMAIPYFFAPCRHAGEEVFDGGLLNNFPLERFLQRHEGDFIGLYLSSGRLVDGRQRSRPSRLFNILLGRDERTIVDSHRDRIITIDPSPIRTTQFQLDNVEKEFLLAAGRAAALQYVSQRRPQSVAGVEIAQAVEKATNLRNQVHTRVRRKRTRRVLLRIALLLLVGIVAYVLLNTGLDVASRPLPKAGDSSPSPVEASAASRSGSVLDRDAARWRKNWATLTEPRGFLGASGGQWTNRAAFLSVLKALDLSTAPELETARRDLISMVEQAPANRSGDQFYDMEYRPEIRDAERDFMRRVRDRAIDVGVSVQ